MGKVVPGGLGASHTTNIVQSTLQSNAPSRWDVSPAEPTTRRAHRDWSAHTEAMKHCNDAKRTFTKFERLSTKLVVTDR